jgi:hypothetical protein
VHQDHKLGHGRFSPRALQAIIHCDYYSTLQSCTNGQITPWSRTHIQKMVFP